MKTIVRAACVAAALLVPVGSAHAALTAGTLYEGKVNDDPKSMVSISVVVDMASPSGLGVDVFFGGIKLHCTDGTGSRASFSDHAPVDEHGHFHTGPAPILSAKTSYSGDLNAKKGTGVIKYKSLNDPVCKSGELPWKVKTPSM
jgi:hypothetical protein